MTLTDLNVIGLNLDNHVNILKLKIEYCTNYSDYVI